MSYCRAIRLTVDVDRMLTSEACFLQGGGVFELFTGQGNNPVANWKLCGGPAAIRKVSFLTTGLL